MAISVNVDISLPRFILSVMDPGIALSFQLPDDSQSPSLRFATV